MWSRIQSCPRLSYTACWAPRGSVLTPGWRGRFLSAPRSALPGAFGGAASAGAWCCPAPCCPLEALRGSVLWASPGGCLGTPCRSQAPAHLSSFSRPHRSASVGVSTQLCTPALSPPPEGPCSGREPPRQALSLAPPLPLLWPGGVCTGTWWARQPVASVAASFGGCALAVPAGAASAALWSVSRLNNDPVAVRSKPHLLCPFVSCCWSLF